MSPCFYLRVSKAVLSLFHKLISSGKIIINYSSGDAHVLEVFVNT